MAELPIANYIMPVQTKPAPLSVVEMMVQLNLQPFNPDNQILDTDYNTFVTDPEITDPVATEEIIKPTVMIYKNNIDPTIIGVFGSADMTSLPPIIGMPGLETTTATVSEDYDQFQQRMAAAAEVKFYDETVPMIATIGAAGAIALYLMTKSPKKRRS